MTPRSSQSKVSVESGAVRVWVTAAPTDGQANEAVCRLIAKAVGVAPSRVSVVRGDTNRDKVLRIEGMDLPSVMGKLA